MKEPQNNPQQQYPYSQQPPQQQYPYSQQQYPYSQQSQQQYPYSQQYIPYSPEPQNSGGLKIWQVAAIVGGAIFALIIIFMLLVMVKHQQNAGGGIKDYESYASYEVPVRQLEVDGTIVDLPQKMLSINDLSYIELRNFAEIFGYQTSLDAKNAQATVAIDGGSVTFTNDNDRAIVKYNDKTTTEAMEGKPLMFAEEGMYVPLRDMQNLFDLKEVDWDAGNNKVIVSTR